MKTFIFIISLLLFFGFQTAWGQIKNQKSSSNSESQVNLKTIYDIQYTLDPYGESPLKDSEVTVVGVVTSSAHEYDLGYVYIQDEGGGPWSGIFIYGNDLNQFYRGEEIEITGKVVEIGGVTYISVTSAKKTGLLKEIVATDVDPGDSLSFVANGWEKWEGVLVRYKDPDGAKLNISMPNAHSSGNYGDYAVSAIGKNPIKKMGFVLAGRQANNYYSSLWVQIVNDSMWYDNSGKMNVGPIEADTWMEMDAVVGQMFYAYSEYHLTPRNNDDFISINVDLDSTFLPTSPLTAISDITQNDLKIYPNPVSDVVYIVSGSKSIQFYEVYDMYGRKLIGKQFNSHQIQIDVSGLQTGIYVVVAHTEDNKSLPTKIYVKK